ncbi:putative E3 ubiquitin-protein ligase HERC6 [Nelusetta ayraudi]|uniref:putative E3 ubiquitin-protein ligase HERC6 n=1 Tax=Nelusetta ayraudi TaxID=303726 RepID=UPI003F6FB53F
MPIYRWGDTQAGGAHTLGPQPWVLPGDISDISCGGTNTLVLTNDGDVLTPGRVDGLSAVVSVACGRDHSLAACAAGRLFSWGAAEDGQLGISPPPSGYIDTPRCVPTPLAVRVIQVACGNAHSLALTIGGEVLSWGSNSHGQLGHGKEVSPSLPTPAQVAALTGVAVTQISAGGTHSLFLTLPGLVYCCGANQSGQLGLNRVDETGRFNICRVPGLRPLGVSFISCGEAHTAVLTKGGKVLTFGEGRHGQLGHDSTDDELYPREVVGVGELVSQISCGRRHTLVLGSSGQLWAFGDGGRGQIGDGRAEDRLTPTLIQVVGAGAAATDLKISAGWDSSFAFARPKQMAPDRGQVIGRLDDAKLQSWLTATAGDAQATSEITAMFESASSLVASFTKAGGCPPVAGGLTVDLEAASRAFDRMLEAPWIKEAVNLGPVTKSLFCFRTALKSPEIILLLLTCPFLQESTRRPEVQLLAFVIKDLSQKCLEQLTDWWSSLSASIFLEHILVFRETLAFILKNNLHVEVKNLLKVLELLYKANKSRKSFKIQLSTFRLQNEEIAHINILMDFCFWMQFPNQDSALPIFCHFPFLLNLKFKNAILKIFTTAEQNVQNLIHVREKVENPLEAPPAPIFQLTLRLTHVLEDTYRQLEAADHIAFKRKLLVQFVDNREIDNVNVKDFFLHVFKVLMAPESELFMFNETKTACWFPPKPKEKLKTYFLLGVLCGLALYNQNIVHLLFPLALFKKLLRSKPSLDDMREFDPALADSLHGILEEDPAEVENMGLTFSVPWAGETVELDPREAEKPVTASNRKEFVAAYVKYAFSDSVEATYKEFETGFFKVCSMKVVDIFQPEELQQVMVGQLDYDWDQFKQNTVYDGEYHANHPNIVTFWQVFENLTEEEKKKFYLFVTGLDRIPCTGMKGVRMRVSVLSSVSDLGMPQSQTCFFQLLLPIYQQNPAETMRSRLLQAINHKRGFKTEDAAGSR